MKLTQTQNALLAGLATLLVTSLSVALAGIHPFLSNGTIDWNGLAIYLTGTALPTFGAALLAYVKSHEPQVMQAAEDTAQELHVPPSDVNAIHTALGEIRGILLYIVNQQVPQPRQASATPAQQPVSAQAQHPLATPAVAPVQNAVPVPSSVPNPLSGLDLASALQVTQPRIQAVQPAQ